jgi:hypothetical protein
MLTHDLVQMLLPAAEAEVDRSYSRSHQSSRYGIPFADSIMIELSRARRRSGPYLCCYLLYLQRITMLLHYTVKKVSGFPVQCKYKFIYVQKHI